MEEPTMTYWFQGMKFEFIEDKVLVTDSFFKRKYEIEFAHDEVNPFRITLVEKNVHDLHNRW
jgi:hypothetical protein